MCDGTQKKMVVYALEIAMTSVYLHESESESTEQGDPVTGGGMGAER
jgi:hypothetical protein